MIRTTFFVVTVLGSVGSLLGQVTWRKSEYLAAHQGVRLTTLGPTGGVMLCCGIHPFETWQWNGVTKTWTKRVSAHVPVTLGPLFNSALAFDSSRGRVVLQGGWLSAPLGPAISNATWEWDGLDWSQRLPNTVGPYTGSMPCAYDSARQQTVLRTGGATWLWDGTDWSQSTAPGPASQERYGIAFDSVRQRTVLFGGLSGIGPTLAETWEWDGLVWQQRQPAVFPPAREYGAMTFDAGRNCVVLFGGRAAGGAELNDTWEWDGTTWQQVLTPTPPPLMSPAQYFGQPALAFDFTSQRCILRLGAATPLSSATWEYDGSNWAMVQAPTCPDGAPLVYDSVRQQVIAVLGGAQHWGWDGAAWQALPPASSPPPPRGFPALGFDRQRGKLVRFGGENSTGYFNDTWELNGIGWSQVPTNPSPPARSFALMTWDATRNHLVLFGGYNGNPLFDMWAWDGVAWTQLASWPGAQQNFDKWFGFVHDSRRDRLVALAHYYTATWSTQTWEWNGLSWSQRFPAHPLCAGFSEPAVLVYDERRSRSVFVGQCSSAIEWDGIDWKTRAPLEDLPHTIWGYSAAYDPLRGEVVVTGGVMGSMVNYDVWTYEPTQHANYASFGAGCAGGSGVPVLRALQGQLPWLDDTFTREVTPIPNGAPTFLLVGLQTNQWNGVALPLALAAAGAPGCSLLISVDVGVLMTTSGSSATQSMSLPNQPAILGLQIHDQAVVLDPAANAFGAVFSNGGTLTAGGR